MFIRTKEGIFEVEQTSANGVDLKCKPIESPLKIHIYIHEFVKNKEIINRAETIEELCDVAVIVGKRYDGPYHWWFYRDKDAKKNDLAEIVKNYMEIWGNEDYMVFENVYGAIWTDKGLIYVAKMNEKGELELL